MVMPVVSSSFEHGLLVVGQAAVLVSWWKPLVLLLPFLGWAWVVASVLDKHAARFYLPRATYNLVHLVVGLVALAAGFLMPVPGIGGFLAGLGAIIVILGADIGIFMALHNKSDQVPADFKLGLDFSKLAALRKNKDQKKAGKVELNIIGSDKQSVPAPEAESPAFQVRVAAENLYIQGVSSRGYQIDLQPVSAQGKDVTYGSSFLIDGVRTSGAQMPATSAVPVIDFWKSAAKLDLNERRKKLQGDLTVERFGQKQPVRVIASGVQGGMRLTLMIDAAGQVRRSADELGLLPEQRAELDAIINNPKGVVLLAALPDAGRTTLLYSIAKMHDPYRQTVQTVELEQQDVLDAVKQNLWEPTADGPDFGTLVRSILRRDPQVVLVSDVPDQNTAKEIARSDFDRTRTYAAVTAPSAIDAVAEWLRKVGDPELASKGLQGVVAVRLMRKLCTNCRMEYTPAPDILKKLGLPADKVKKLYKKGGRVIVKDKEQECPQCGGGGYFGQEGMLEVYSIGPAERELIKAGNLNGLRTELRKKSLPSIQAAALRKATEGVTSVEEITRVTAPPAAPAPKPAATPAKPAAAGPQA